jgi:protoporphyrinogen oxidase
VAVVGWQRQPDGRVRGMGALKAGIYDPAMSDEAFTAAVLEEALRFEPALAGHVRETMVYRWHHKVPTFRPGYLDALKAFKAAPAEDPVYFCGDYLIMGSAGSALASGVQCAGRIDPQVL